jgi:hypothetical protein
METGLQSPGPVVRSLPPLASMAILTTLIIFIDGMVGWSTAPATDTRLTES